MTNHLRDLLAKALPDTQPISLTAQQLVTAGRRRRLRRRIGYLSSGTTAVALVAAGALLLPPLLDGTPRHDGAALSASAAPSDAPVSEPTTIEELGDEIWALFVAEAPDLQMSPGVEFDERDEPFDLGEPAYVPGVEPGDELADLSGFAYLTTSQGEPAGWVGIHLYRPGEWNDEPANDPPWDQPTDLALIACWSGSFRVSDDGDPPVSSTGIVERQCAESSTADGDKLLTAHGDEFNQDLPLTSFSNSWNTVVVFRSDGTAVKAVSYCGNSAEDDDETNHCLLGPQFTIDQLSSIVTRVPAVPPGDD